MSVRECLACHHPKPHNIFGKCSSPGCGCKTYTFDPATPIPPKEPARDPEVVQVLRNQVTGAPIAIPDEIITFADRTYRAYRMHCGGKSWEAIALLETWTSAQEVATAVKRYLEEGAAVWGEFRRVEAIALEAARYNMLTDFVWKEAEAGNIPAVMAALAISKQRVAVLKLGEVQPGDEGGDPLPTTVVVGEGTYLFDLKKIVDGPEAYYGRVVFDDDDPDSEPYLTDLGTVTPATPI